MFELDQTSFILAFDEDGPAGPATKGDTSSKASTEQQQEDDSSGGGGGSDMMTMMLPLLAIMALLIFFSFRGQRKERKRRDALLSAVEKHDKVQTIGGIVGSVVEIKPTTIVLKVDESSNTRMTFAKSAVQQVLTETTEEH